MTCLADSKENNEILDMKGLEHRSQVIALVRHDIVCLDDKHLNPSKKTNFTISRGKLKLKMVVVLNP